MNPGPKQLTLCVVHDEARVLLGLKKRGFGMGKWNGFGGKVAPGETVEDAARRELEEEARIRALDLRRRGRLTFEFESGEEDLEVHLFSATRWEGDPSESDEMRPDWFARDAVPFERMWADDRHWLPHLLDGRDVEGHFRFRDPETLVGWSVMLH